jgi:bifunctional non-homologous end joining protein LigD
MSDEQRNGVELTNLDQPLFDDSGVTKRELVDYLDLMHTKLIPVLQDRPLSIIRARPGQAPFMQKNTPKGAPDWIQTTAYYAESSQRNVSYTICNDRRTLLWLANQRAVEFHPTLVTVKTADCPTYLVIDLDPPHGAAFDAVIEIALTVREVLATLDLSGVVKTSGSKGLHIFVPLVDGTSGEDATHAVRALAIRTEQSAPTLATTAFIKSDRGGKVFVDSTRSGGATVIATYSPRTRTGLPVSFPVPWDSLREIVPSDFTVRSVPKLVENSDPWSALMPAAQFLPSELIVEGRLIPTPRVAALHEGKRRAAKRT